MIVESLWLYEGPFSKKTFISPTDFNDFIKLGGEFRSGFGAALRCLLAYECDFGCILGSLWGHFGHIEVEWQA